MLYFFNVVSVLQKWQSVAGFLNADSYCVSVTARHVSALLPRTNIFKEGPIVNQGIVCRSGYNDHDIRKKYSLRNVYIPHV